MGAKKETKPVKVEKVITNEVSIPKTLTLDEVEAEMVKCLSVQETSKVFLMSQKFDMLQKFAAYKLKRMEIEQTQAIAVQAANEPIRVVYVDSDTEEERKRIEKLDQSVREARGIKEDAWYFSAKMF